MRRRRSYKELELENKLLQDTLASTEKDLYEFTSSGILCTNHINCRDQLCVNLDTGELIPHVRSQ